MKGADQLENQLTYYLLDVFTSQVFGGNQLAVFPDASGLDADQMQLIARELNLSETVFVFPAQESGHTCQLRIFTPRIELPFAGHPTVGTAYLLSSLGRIPTLEGENQAIFEEGAGPVPVTVQVVDGRPVFSQLAAAALPHSGPPCPPPAVLAEMLSLQETDILTGEYGPEAVSAGVPFQIIPLRSLAAIRKARLVESIWEQQAASHWAPHIYLFTMETEQPEAQVHARMFAPAMGIKEDPATGAAAAALAGYLANREDKASGTLTWAIEQGAEMGRPAILQIEVDKVDCVITAVRVGGSAVIIGEGRLVISR